VLPERVAVPDEETSILIPPPLKSALFLEILLSERTTIPEEDTST
jgi:hypothetical protein